MILLCGWAGGFQRCSERADCAECGVPGGRPGGPPAASGGAPPLSHPPPPAAHTGGPAQHPPAQPHARRLTVGPLDELSSMALTDRDVLVN